MARSSGISIASAPIPPSTGARQTAVLSTAPAQSSSMAWFSSTPAIRGSAECLEMSCSPSVPTTSVMSRTLVVRRKHVIRPGSSGPASIHIRDGVIAAIQPFESVPAGAELVETENSFILPGLVDTHVHFNDPGRAHWEGFEFGTHAAAAGGVTTLID